MPKSKCLHKTQRLVNAQEQVSDNFATGGGDWRRPNLNGKFVLFDNKRLIDNQNKLTNGTGQKQTPTF
jgi:hypothetical protein